MLETQDLLPDGLQVTPDTYSYNAAINACEKGGNYPLAQHLLKSMANDVTPTIAARYWLSVAQFLNTIAFLEKNMSVGQGGPWVGQIVVALATADVPGKLQHNHQCLWKEWEMVFSTWLLLCHVSWKFALLVVMPAKQTTKHLDASIYEQRRLFGEAKSSYGAYMGIPMFYRKQHI